jgi:hypothetical protein
MHSNFQFNASQSNFIYQLTAFDRKRYVQRKMRTHPEQFNINSRQYARIEPELLLIPKNRVKITNYLEIVVYGP